jgi:hypothetical protein
MMFCEENRQILSAWKQASGGFLEIESMWFDFGGNSKR